MRENMKKYITVLDYETSRVYQYKVSVKTHSEKFITLTKGHRLGNIEWMEHNIGIVVTK